VVTLSKHRRRPALRPLDLRNVSVATVMGKYPDVLAYLQAKGGGKEAYPEHEAISFYLANSIYAKVAQRVQPDEPLGAFEPLVEAYQETVRATSLRMFFYLLLICTRESRHMHSNVSLEKALQHQYGGCMDFTRSIKGLSSDYVVQRMISNPPDILLGPYTDHLVDLFMKGKWSPQYGGKKWGEIAKVLRNFVHGVLSPELLLDTGFTLAHNGGPIFNKHVLYHTYESKELCKVLDVQRAGMIPQLVYSNASHKVTMEHIGLNTRAIELLGDECTGPVDWAKVMKLGAKQDYSKYLPKSQAAKKKVAPVPAAPAADPNIVTINPKLALAKASNVRLAP